MKTRRIIVAAAIALGSAFGGAHAALCNGVKGTLEVAGAAITDPALGCSGTSFSWTDTFGADPTTGLINGSKPHRLSATVTNTSIHLEMSLGFYNQFQNDLIWTFTLVPGLTFASIVETSDSFDNDEDKVQGTFGNAELLSTLGTRVASFKIRGSDHVYTETWNAGYTLDNPFVADYTVRVAGDPIQVPEPSTLLLMASAIGALALARRQRSER